MRLRPIVPLSVAVVLAMPAATRAQVPYTYFRVAATGGTSGFAGLFAPQINQVGSVAFGANLTNGGSGIFVGTGSPFVVVPIVQNGPTFTGFTVPPAPIVAAINPNSNMTAFFATRTAAAGGGAGIFTSDSVTTSTIASTSGGFSSFGIGADINAGNNVAFTAATPTTQGVFIGAPGAPLTTVATTGAVFSTFNSAVAVNNVGSTSFAAGFTPAAGGGAGVLRWMTNNTTTAIARSGGTFNGFAGPTDINNAGQVAFIA